MWYLLLSLLGFLDVTTAAPTISPSLRVQLVEGSSLEITCCAGEGNINPRGLFLYRNGSELPYEMGSRTLNETARSVTYSLGPVNRSYTGSIFSCLDNLLPKSDPNAVSEDLLLIVSYPPVLVGDIQQSVTLNAGAPFTLNCTPVDEGNPPATVSFSHNNTGAAVESVTTTGYVLSVSSVVRNHRGYYSCEVSNGVGRDSVTVQLMVRAPPTVPKQLMLLVNGPFSVTLSWEVPSDDGGTSRPLLYTVRVINDTVNLSFSTTSTQLNLTMDDGIWHSSMYSVTVVVENEYRVSPPAASTFTTPDSVPIIESVSVEALSLTILSVDVVLLTEGGQNVDNYNILITSAGYMNENVVSTAQLMSHNFTVETLREGVYYNVNVRAVNRVGPSETFQTGFTVNINMPTIYTPFPQVNTPAIVGGVIGAVVLILLIILVILIILLCYLKRKEIRVTKENKAAGLHLTKEREVNKAEPIVSMYADTIHDEPINEKSETSNINKEGLVYADLAFANKSTKKPPKDVKQEEAVIYSEVRVAD